MSNGHNWGIFRNCKPLLAPAKFSKISDLRLFMSWKRVVPCVLSTFVAFTLAQAQGDESAPSGASPNLTVVAQGENPGPGPGGASAPQGGPPPYSLILKDAQPINGLMSLYRKGDNLVAELSPADYGSEYIFLISISRGIGQNPILGGMSLYFGDDWVLQFRKFEDKVHLVRKNVRFRANPGSPESTAVKNAYTDSVLFSLPIMAKGPRGGDLVDLTQVFMSDLPQISQMLPGFMFSPQKSTIAEAKAFKDNVELEIAATYASGGFIDLDNVPDSRGVSIVLHYSISRLNPTGYQPRLADDRVGYFTTVVKDFSSRSDRSQFVRYINRWDLQKADPSSPLSTPKSGKQIVFWIEKTVPFKYRKAIHDGVAEWNKAFETAGFVNAIDVREQLESDDWDPEDINYNTFRWITANAGFAMGPSRVNPYTGQILDADIIFDADFVQTWKDEFESVTPLSVAELTGGPLTPEEAEKQFGKLPWAMRMHACQLGEGMAHQFAFGSMILKATNADPKVVAEKQEKLIMQGLKEVTMHEVGHTLGLRHNFKASKMLSLKDINDPTKTSNGSVASVMDYNPTNLVPKEWQQGDYYPTTVGPYDVWAIQYGYTPFPGGTMGEVGELQKIAGRSGEPNLSYATDEDTRGFDPDPDSNRFDLGTDPIEYARTRAQVVSEAWAGLVDRIVKDGEDYSQARRAFNLLLSQHGQAMFFASRYVGGLHTSRSHKGDKDGKPPIRAVDAKLQRDALQLIEEQILSDKPYLGNTEAFNFLVPTTWNHWGLPPNSRKDYAIHDIVALFQDRILDQMLNPTTLKRMHDLETKTPGDVDLLTTAELIERLDKSIFTELDSIKEGEFTNRKPAISNLRRDLQRRYLSRLSNMAMGLSGAPEDCETIAFAELNSLDAKFKQLLTSNVKLDSYTRAHLVESSSRIQKVLDARLSLPRP